MDANIAIAQARGLRRVAADLDRVWDDYLKGNRTPADDNDAIFPAEEFLGSMLAAPVVRALAAELALKAVAIKTTGTHKLGHDLLKLFDALDQKTQTAIEQERKGVIERAVHGSVRSILAKHKDDFTASRYVGEMPAGWLCPARPSGTASSIASRVRRRLSGSSPAVSDRRTAVIPHPMSTPTAAGISALRVGITDPTVAPMPRCTSGIAATCPCTIGSRETAPSCSMLAWSMSSV